MDAIYAALFSWAITLSGMPQPAEPPVVVTKPHSFFVKKACGGKECRVYGWYAGGRAIYIEESLNPKDSLVAASVVVHEMVHYLQGTTRNQGLPANGAAYTEKPGCEEAIGMEREAYAVQREFLQRYGPIYAVGIAMQRVSCG